MGGAGRYPCAPESGKRIQALQARGPVAIFEEDRSVIEVRKLTEHDEPHEQQFQPPKLAQRSAPEAGVAC